MCGRFRSRLTPLVREHLERIAEVGFAEPAGPNPPEDRAKAQRP